LFGVVETSDRPRLAVHDNVIDTICASRHQHIVGILAALWVFDLPAAILADAAGDLFCHRLPRCITVGGNDDLRSGIDLLLCFP
jgi:hypothetical protein